MFWMQCETHCLFSAKYIVNHCEIIVIIELGLILDLSEDLLFGAQILFGKAAFVLAMRLLFRTNLCQRTRRHLTNRWKAKSKDEQNKYKKNVLLNVIMWFSDERVSFSVTHFKCRSLVFYIHAHGLLYSIVKCIRFFLNIFPFSYSRQFYYSSNFFSSQMYLLARRVYVQQRR